jgi:hypothetical protein
MAKVDAATIMQAARAVIRFSSHDWAADICVPTAVVVMKRDRLVSPQRQYGLAQRIPGAKVFEVDGDHLACVSAARRFVPALLDACAYVVATAERPPAAARVSASASRRVPAALAK